MTTLEVIPPREPLGLAWVTAGGYHSKEAVPQPRPGQKKWNKLWFWTLFQFHWIPRWFGFQTDCLSVEASLTPSPGRRSLQRLTLSSSPEDTYLQRPKTSSCPCARCGAAPGPWASGSAACTLCIEQTRKQGWPLSGQCQTPAL